MPKDDSPFGQARLLWVIAYNEEILTNTDAHRCIQMDYGLAA
ncbi:hypothetical protein [Fischerella sp. JS2]|nr:hypothetical protein [Fischerella sp. JS2]